MDKRTADATAAGTLPLPFSSPSRAYGRRRRPSVLPYVAFLAFVVVLLWPFFFPLTHSPELAARKLPSPQHIAQILEKCSLLTAPPGPPRAFFERKISDRFVEGTKPTLIKNATIWTGADGGSEVVRGDILLDGGIVKAVGVVDRALLDTLNLSPEQVQTIDAKGAWVSPGIVDMHSHLAVDAAPALHGAADGNSRKGPILPWLRALDALNTHDDAYALSISGGVTTALVLPGSANAIGGQGVVIKLRRTSERSPTAMLLESPYEANTTVYDERKGWRWRQMKHACGENPDRVYANTRMDTTWAFRQAYDTARHIKRAQDAFCERAERGEWAALALEDPSLAFPEDLQWEALVDVLRGRVKVHNHCYETVDLDDMVRITNEFEFSIAAFHHAHETYLVPGTLKAAYGHPPAAALFATNARYKRESYRGSEFAPRILAENGIQVVMKSDHPVLNSRHLIYEAQQAHYYGLDPGLALLSVTGTSATVIGQEHRVGFVKKGYDADIVLWDSHPLALGATPQQVWIDGIAQLSAPYVVRKPAGVQRPPKTPDFEREKELVLEHDGLPPLEPREALTGQVLFVNVSGVLTRALHGGIQEAFTAEDGRGAGVVLVENGRVVCVGAAMAQCNVGSQASSKDTRIVDLEGGWISPGLISFGSPLGLEEIAGEASTSDSWVPDALVHDVPAVVGGTGAIVRAADGLQYATRNALLAYRSGVTVGVTAPKSAGLLSGLSAVFSTAAVQPSDGLVQEVAAVHVTVQHGANVPSVSTQIAALRNLLRGKGSGELGRWFDKVIRGDVPLVVNVHSADAMISLLRLKESVEQESGAALKLVFAGATEAHLIAEHIADANVGVIISPSRPFPHDWQSRRILPGPPLSEERAVSLLLSHNVTVAVGVTGAHEARNTRFDIGWVALQASGRISRKDAIALASTNLEKLLGIQIDEIPHDLVATKGGDLLQFQSKVVAIISGTRGVVDII